MNSNCIITQVHIPDHDVQGDWHYVDKVEFVSFALKHLRAFNPNAYIILTGHGHRPHNLGMCDWVFWNDTCEQLDKYGYVAGMPAQYKYVSTAIRHARAKGFDRCLKTRGDCVIGIPNITKYCDNILDAEGTKLLITQQTDNEMMGDCFMFGDVVIMDRIWSKDNYVCHSDGLVNTAKHFRRAMNMPNEPWDRLVTSVCSFRDVHVLKFACLRWNKLPVDTYDMLLDPLFNFTQYHWGKATSYHALDQYGNMTGRTWSRKTFYEKGGRFMQPKLLILDVDGVMTDGTKVYDNHGAVIAKRFCDHDFTAIKKLKMNGWKVCWLSADRNINEVVANDRGIDFYYSRDADDTIDKVRWLYQLISHYGMPIADVMYVGDDLFDAQIMLEIKKGGGKTFCPANAVPQIKNIVDSVLASRGGHGAIMDLCCNFFTDVEQPCT